MYLPFRNLQVPELTFFLKTFLLTNFLRHFKADITVLLPLNYHAKEYRFVQPHKHLTWRTDIQFSIKDCTGLDPTA